MLVKNEPVVHALIVSENTTFYSILSLSKGGQAYERLHQNNEEYLIQETKQF